jgi:hypothetical protein
LLIEGLDVQDIERAGVARSGIGECERSDRHGPAKVSRGRGREQKRGDGGRAAESGGRRAVERAGRR